VAVSVDGVELAPAEVGRAIPVEVGDHTVRAEAKGHKPYRLSVHLPGGETREIRIELEPSGDDAVALVPLAPAAPAAAGPPEPPPPTPPRRDEAKRPSALPYIAGGAALAGFVTAGVFYALRHDALDTMQAGCNGTKCPEDLRSLDEKGALYTTIANVALAAGVGLSGVSAGLFISELSDDEGQREVTIRASVRGEF
jgi:hypothetical protein